MPRLNRNARLLILSVVLGVVGALGAQLFEWMLNVAQHLLLTGIGHFTPPTPGSVAGATGPPATTGLDWWIPLVTTLGGLLAGLLVYTLAPEAEGHGTDAVVRAYHRERGRIRARVPVVKSIASAITIGSGGSAGREGPTAQIAAGVGALVGDLLKVTDDERRYLTLIGMAAGLSAIFKSPLGTAIFAVEILYGGLAFEETVLSFAIVAAAVAYGLNGMFDGWAPLFTLPVHLEFDNPVHLLWYGALGVACGGLGALLPTVFYGTRDLFKKIPIPRHLKPALGGFMLGVPAMFLPQVLGGGYGWMQLAIDGHLPLFLMLGLALAKLPALSLSVGSGGSGGVFAPTLYVGAMLGGAIAVGLGGLAHGVPPQAFAVVGMAAIFGAAARVPLATLVMVVEMTGGYGLIVPTMVAVVPAVLLQQALTTRAKYPSLYEAQVPSPADSPVHHEEILPDHALAAQAASLPPRRQRHDAGGHRTPVERALRSASWHDAVALQRARLAEGDRGGQGNPRHPVARRHHHHQRPARSLHGRRTRRHEDRTGGPARRGRRGRGDSADPAPVRRPRRGIGSGGRDRG